MNSTEINNSFSRNLHKIDKKLKECFATDRHKLFKECINHKLVETLKTYNEEVDVNSSFLIEQSTIRVLKALTKLQKKDDKAVLEELANEAKEGQVNNE